MTTSGYGMELMKEINTYYGEEMVYAKYPKCFTKDGIEISNWGLKEWAYRISTKKEIGNISNFYRRLHE